MPYSRLPFQGGRPLIGAPIERYAQSLAAQGASSAISPATQISAGTQAILFATASVGNKVISSVSDNVGGNTWVVDATGDDSGAPGILACSIASCRVVNAIGTGATITVNYSPTTNNQVHIWIQEVAGLVPAFAFDKSATAFAATTNLAAGPTGALTHSNEIVFAVSRAADMSGWAKGASYSNPTTPTLGAPLSSLEYKTVLAGNPVSSDGTISTGVGGWVMLLATYRGIG